MADFWSDGHWDTVDHLNSVVWRLSPALTWRLHGEKILTEAGDVGAEQAMVPGRDCPLPWVPDLIGKDSRNEHGVLVVGSAYSPFIDGLAGRRAKMSIRTYEAAAADRNGWPIFQAAFRAAVIKTDADYYPAFERLFEGLLDPVRLMIIDLCRGSFCRRGSRPDRSHEHPYFDAGGDGVVICNPGLFRAYTEAKVPDRWLWARMTQTKASRDRCPGISGRTWTPTTVLATWLQNHLSFTGRPVDVAVSFCWRLAEKAVRTSAVRIYFVGSPRRLVDHNSCIGRQKMEAAAVAASAVQKA